MPRLVPCPAGAVPGIAAGRTGGVREPEGEEEEPEPLLEPIVPLPEALQPLRRRLPFPAVRTASP